MPAIEAALESDADALLIDMAFGTARARSGVARVILRSLSDRLRQRPRKPLYIRQNGCSSGGSEADLDAAILLDPDGVALSRASGAMNIGRLASRLSVREALHGIADGATGIIAAFDTAAALLSAGEIASSSPRLTGLSWDAKAIALELGIAAFEPQDAPYSPLPLARSLCRFAAAAARKPAIDTASAQTDPDLFRKACEAARRDGFSAKIAIDTDQVAIINTVFGPGGPRHDECQAEFSPARRAAIAL